MSLTLPEVMRIAQLARIGISAAEASATQEHLNRVFTLIETMQSADTSGVLPMAHASEAAQRLRADVVSEPDWRAAVMPLAPAAQDGLYLVPKVIE